MYFGKRAHKRYIVSGVAQLDTGGSTVPSQLVSLGGGGMMVRSEIDLPKETLIGVDFSVTGFPADPVAAKSAVVWTQPGKIGLKFLQEPPGLPPLLGWLERERCPWSS